MKNKIKMILLLLLVIAVSGIHAYQNWETPIYDTTIGSGAYDTVGEIYDDIEVKQEFYSAYNGLNGVNLRIAAYDRENNSDYKFVVRNYETEEIVREGNINVADFADNTFNKIKFTKIEDSADKKYIFEIKGEDVPEGQGITAFTTDGGTEIIEKYGDESKKDVLVMKVITKRFNVEDFIVFAGLIIYVGLFIKLLNRFLK